MTTDDEIQNLPLEYLKKNSLFFNDFANNGSNAGNNSLIGKDFYAQVGGAGANVQNPAPNFLYETGIVRPQTGSTAGGRAGYFIYGNLVVLDEKKITFQNDIRLDSGLADATNNFTIRSGFLKNATTSAANNVTDGIYFQYRGDGFPNWEAVCVNNNTATIVDTGIAVQNLGNPTFLEIKAQRGAGLTEQAEFFINGVSVAIITTNLPSATLARAFGAGAYIVKSAGTTARSFESDYVNVFIERTEQGLRP